MKKLFVQFYLLLFVCFLVMTMLVGLVYKFTAERAGRQSLDDLMKSSLYLMRSELREIPPRDWSKTLKELDLNLSFDLHIEPMSKFKLSESSMQHLREGFALQDFVERTGLPVTAIAKALGEAERKGLITRDMARVRPTERGFDFLNDLQALFLAD